MALCAIARHRGQVASNNLHRVAKGVLDMRWAVGEPFLKGADEQ
jgi:hypothetical protein